MKVNTHLKYFHQLLPLAGHSHLTNFSVILRAIVWRLQRKSCIVGEIKLFQLLSKVKLRRKTN